MIEITKKYKQEWKVNRKIVQQLEADNGIQFSVIKNEDGSKNNNLKEPKVMLLNWLL